MYQILLVAVGGALGAAVRYGTSVWVLRFWDEPAVLATWAFNLAGYLLIGMMAPMLGRVGLAKEVQIFLIVGFLGSLTTFSTFSLETVVLWQEGLGSRGFNQRRRWCRTGPDVRLDRPFSGSDAAITSRV